MQTGKGPLQTPALHLSLGAPTSRLPAAQLKEPTQESPDLSPATRTPGSGGRLQSEHRATS